MLTKEELQKLEVKLKESKAGLERQVKDLETHADYGDDVDHGEKEADEDEEFSTRHSEAETLRVRLARVVMALDKITEGKYGTCEKCGKEMSLAMLDVDPESELCKECKLAERE
jgi:DnaK suppressor protein